MFEPKPFKTYSEQVDLLVSRGMNVTDASVAREALARLNYYRLSGYWHTMRQVDPDTGHSLNVFRPGASFDTVLALHDFDLRLRSTLLGELAPIEIAMRAVIGYELGRIDPLIHLDPASLGAPARQPRHRGGTKTTHEWWMDRFDKSVASSKEDFVAHHVRTYGSKMPIWAAVEVMDWGLLSYLYRMAPGRARNLMAERCDLTAPQLESWLKALNVLRNLAAHQARLFNRSFDIKPKLSIDSRLDAVKESANRIFGQLTLVQYLHRQLTLSTARALPAVLATYPDNPLIPFSRLGAPPNWRQLELWQIED